MDNQNGIRDGSVEEVLKDEDEVNEPGWQVATVARQGIEYLTDSRDYFINFELLVAEELLEDIPPTASPDNTPPGSNRTLIGPYSWFVNDRGIVDSLLYNFPIPENTGFQDVFPSQQQPEPQEASTISDDTPPA